MLELLPAPLEIVESTGNAAPFSTAIEQLVNEIWEQEKAKRPHLFDGEIFTVESISPQRASGRFVPYRYFIAQLNRPDLFSELHLQVLAVSGALFSPEGIVFGLRDKTLTQQGGFWELVPSGGIDRHSLMESGRLDVIKQLMVELEEEVGLASQDITSTEISCLIHDTERHVLDIGVKIETSRPISEILTFHRTIPQTEHIELRVISPAAVAGFMEETGKNFLPASAVILRGLGVIPPAGFPKAWQKKPPVLLLRADASSQMGVGHLMRSLALAQAWQHFSGDVLYLGQCPEFLQARLDSMGVRRVALQAAPGSIADAEETLDLANRHHATWVILDGYHFTSDFQLRLRTGHWRVGVIDDYGHLPRYDGDLILNQNCYASSDLYPEHATSSRFLFGCQYTLLRDEFTRVARPERVFKNRAKKLLITLGGSDPDGVTLKVLEILPQLDSALEVRLVIGGSNFHREELHRASAAVGAQVIDNATNMVELMDWADVAISAGGSTCWELMHRGVPMLLVILAENQKRNVEALSSAGVAVNLGWHNDWDTVTAKNRLEELLNDAPRREAMSQIGQEMVDGQGVQRVVEFMREYALNVRPVTVADARLLYDWANEPGVREASFHTRPIGWEEHISWFQGKLNDPTCRMYVGENLLGMPVGMIRLDEHAVTEMVVSISVDSRQRGRGIGGRMLDLAMRVTESERLVSKYIALVKPSNHDSRLMFEKRGYQFMHIINFEGMDAIEYHRYPNKTA